MGRQQYTSEVNITNMESGEIVYSRTYLGIQEENVEEKQKKLSEAIRTDTAQKEGKYTCNLAIRGETDGRLYYSEIWHDRSEKTKDEWVKKLESL